MHILAVRSCCNPPKVLIPVVVEVKVEAGGRGGRREGLGSHVWCHTGPPCGPCTQAARRLVLGAVVQRKAQMQVPRLPQLKSPSYGLQFPPANPRRRTDHGLSCYISIKSVEVWTSQPKSLWDGQREEERGIEGDERRQGLPGQMVSVGPECLPHGGPPGANITRATRASDGPEQVPYPSLPPKHPKAPRYERTPPCSRPKQGDY
jgi:hypothetical protein